MSYFRNISLNNYRNFTNSSFEFDNFCNIILGQNGSGKTNLLESLSLVEKGRGLRKEKISNLLAQVITKEECDLKKEEKSIEYSFSMKRYLSSKKV